MAKLEGWQIAKKIDGRLDDLEAELQEEREEEEEELALSLGGPTEFDDEEDFDSDEWLDGERASPFTNW